MYGNTVITIPNDLSYPQADLSRDAKSCVSQGINAIVYSSGIACVCCCGLDGRRKILRLYRATPSLF